MTDNQGYNGWVNFETWCVALWLDNDYETYQKVLKLVEEARKETDEFLDTKGILAHKIKDFVEEMNPYEGANMFIDLMNAALREVEWFDVAEHYLED